MTEQSLGAGLYIHIPFCQRKCPYCAFYSVPVSGRSMDRFADALLREIDLYKITTPPETVYIGGGSPTCLPNETLIRLAHSLKQRFGSVEEFTVECNPAQANAELLEGLRASGVNRISIGAQSFDADELKVLGRLHDPGQIQTAVQSAQCAGFENIGLDLIFGLPDSNLMAWQNTLEKAMTLDVQHVSAYSLTIEKGTPFEKAVQQGSLTMIDEALERTMYELACVQFEKAGFGHYEISNFARPGFQCRHNLRYWKNRSVIGIGPASAGWYQGKRTTNVRDIDAYLTHIEAGRFARDEEQTPDLEQIAIETAVLNLRMRQGIDLAAYKQLTGFDLDELFGEAIQKNCDFGFLETTETHVYLTDLGLSFADTVAADFTSPD